MNMNPTEKRLLSDYEALRRTLTDFIDGALVLRDIDKSMGSIADDVIGIGLGEQGIYADKAGLRRILMDSVREEMLSSKTVVEYVNLDIRVFSSMCASINVEVHATTEVNDKVMTTSFVQMASARKEGDKWLWFMVGAVPMSVSEESINAYPLAFADNTLASLKAEIQSDTFELMAKSFSGGILGTYITEGYPLYYANDILINMLGYEREEFEEKFKDGTVKLSCDDGKSLIHKLAASGIEADNNFGSRAHWIKRDGSTLWVEFRSRKTKDLNGNDVLLSVIWDITDLFEKMNKDALTGVHNRRYTDANLKQIISALAGLNGTLSVLMIDVDFFKKYNDTYGHDMGDVCLKAVSSALSDSLNRAGDFVARYGGEEFLVVLPETDEVGARVVAERIINAVRELEIPHRNSEVAPYITVSVGGTTGRVSGAQTDRDYINRADEALYLSKHSGRDRYTFYNI